MPRHGYTKLYLLDIVAYLCTGVNKQNIQVFGSLFTFFGSYLPGQIARHRTETLKLSTYIFELQFLLVSGLHTG